MNSQETLPIPNTEVKPCSAEDSCLVTGCENRKMPTSDSEYSLFLTSALTAEVFFIILFAFAVVLCTDRGRFFSPFQLSIKFKCAKLAHCLYEIFHLFSLK